MRKVLIGIIAGLIALSLVGTGAGEIIVDSAEWEIEIVEDVDCTGYWSSLYLNSNSYPHIAYGTWGGVNEQVAYAYWNGTGWVKEDLSPTYIPEPYVHDDLTISAVWDSSEYAHIAYCDVNDNLVHAYYNGTNWNYENVTTTSSGAEYVKIGIDSTNILHIVYLDNANSTLKYAIGSLASWSIENITIGSDFYGYPDIAVDSLDKPHISYIEQIIGAVPNEYTLEYATKPTGSWDIETAYTGVYESISTAIDIDSNNKPHIIFASDVYFYGYTDKTSGTWATPTWLVDGIDWGYSLDIVLDNEDSPHIFLPDNEHTANLMWMYYDGFSWYYDNIEQEGEYGVSAVLDDPFIHISYQKYGRGELKYAKYNLTYVDWNPPHGIYGSVYCLPLYSEGVGTDVSCSNDSFSTSIAANTTGYYIFDNLDAGMYWINASLHSYIDNNAVVEVVSGWNQTLLSGCDAL